MSFDENEVTEVTEVIEDEQAQIQAELERQEQERLELERLEQERIEAEERAREQARIEHENFLNSFPDTTVFYQKLKEEGDVKWLCGTVKDARTAESYGWLDNHYDESELTLIGHIYYLKGYEKPDETEAEIIRKKASEIDHELENLLDQTVQTRNYKNVESCVGYYNSTDKTFREEAEAVLKWRDSLYATAREILKQVNEGSIDYRIVDLKYITDRAEPLEW